MLEVVLFSVFLFISWDGIYIYIYILYVNICFIGFSSEVDEEDNFKK